MKKKGLIISTVVMVVVLLASLTTATYAWIQPSSVVNVDTIDFAVAAGADMIIGVHENNSVGGVGASGTTATANMFYSGATTYTKQATFDLPGTWSGTTKALGSNVDLNGLNLQNITKAVGTGTFTGTPGTWSTGDNPVYTAGSNLGGTADAAFSNTNYKTGMIKAEGSGPSVNADTIDTAWKQYDYLDVVFGVQATKNDLQSMTCYVTINPTTTSNIIGMNAAIHVAYEVVTPQSTTSTVGTLTDVDVYGDTNYATTVDQITNTVYNNAKTAYDAVKELPSSGLECLGGDSTATVNPGALTLAIDLKKVTGEEVISMTDIYQLHLVIYIAGFDNDCCEGAKGVGSTINITFAGVSKPKAA